MLIDVHLLDTKTGERRVYVDEYDPQFGEPESSAVFSYGDHNASCDCNRANYFVFAGGEVIADLSDEEDEDHFPCGEGRFAVERLSEHGTGRVIHEGDPRRAR